MFFWNAELGPSLSSVTTTLDVISATPLVGTYS